MKKIIAIVVTHNGEKWLPLCLGSLRKSPLPLTTVVVDNASTDNTAGVIREQYPEVLLFENKVNLGFGRANNVGLKYAWENGFDHIFLLNQDASLEPPAIERLVDAADRNRAYGILSPVHLYTENRLDFMFRKYLKASCPELIPVLPAKKPLSRDIFDVHFVNAALWLISGGCLGKVGGFDPLFSHYGEDHDYIDRVRYHGFRVGICVEAIGYHKRPQRRDVASYYGEGKKYRSLMKVLKKPGRTMPACLLECLARSGKNIAGEVARLDVRGAVSSGKVLLRLLGKLGEIRRHRALCASGTAAFLMNERNGQDA